MLLISGVDGQSTTEGGTIRGVVEVMNGTGGAARTDVSFPIISRREWSDFRNVPCRVYYQASKQRPPLLFINGPFPHPSTSPGSSSSIRIPYSFVSGTILKIWYIWSPSQPLRVNRPFALYPWSKDAVLFRWSDCQTGVHPLFALLHLYSGARHLLPNHQAPPSKLYRFNTANSNAGFLPTCRG